MSDHTGGSILFSSTLPNSLLTSSSIPCDLPPPLPPPPPPVPRPCLLSPLSSSLSLCLSPPTLLVFMACLPLTTVTSSSVGQDLLKQARASPASVHRGNPTPPSTGVKAKPSMAPMLSPREGLPRVRWEEGDGAAPSSGRSRQPSPRQTKKPPETAVCMCEGREVRVCRFNLGCDFI